MSLEFLLITIMLSYEKKEKEELHLFLLLFLIKSIGYKCALQKTECIHQ